MKITRVFLNTDMRQNFEGLRKQAEKQKGSLNGKEANLFFVNTKCNYFKILLNNMYIVSYKSPKGRIPLDALKHLPENFGGSEMEMNEAIKKSLESEMKWSW